MAKRTGSASHAFGRRAERWAALYLRFRGYRVVERNYRTKAGEIDIIAEKGATLAFVEVKARSHGAYGSPREAVDEHKRRRITAAAALYLAGKRGRWDSLRFDVVTVEKGGLLGLRIEHVKGAFDAEF